MKDELKPKATVIRVSKREKALMEENEILKTRVKALEKELARVNETAKRMERELDRLDRN